MVPGLFDRTRSNLLIIIVPIMVQGKEDRTNNEKGEVMGKIFKEHK